MEHKLFSKIFSNKVLARQIFDSVYWIHRNIGKYLIVCRWKELNSNVKLMIQYGFLDQLKDYLENVPPYLIRNSIYHAIKESLLNSCYPMLSYIIKDLNVNPYDYVSRSNVLLDLSLGGSLECLHLLEETHSFANENFYHYRESIDQCSFKGNLDIMKWIATRAEKHFWSTGLDRYLSNAVIGNHFEVLKWLFTNFGRVGAHPGVKISSLFVYNRLEMLEWMIANRYIEELRVRLTPMISDRTMEHIEWCLNNNFQIVLEYSAIVHAASLGNLPLVKWIDENVAKEDYYVDQAMEAAAKNGRLQVLQWFYSRYTELSPNPHVMNVAAANGKLEIVKWLHENSNHGCTKIAMNKSKCLETLRWLHENRTEGFTREAIDECKYKSVEVIQFLLDNKTEDFTEVAVTNALTNRQFEVFKVLTQHAISWGMEIDLNITALQFDTLCAHGQLDFIQYLYECKEVFGVMVTKNSIDRAVQNDQFEVLKYLDFIENEGCTNSALSYSILGNKVEIFKFLTGKNYVQWTNRHFVDAISYSSYDLADVMIANLCPDFDSEKVMEIAKNYSQLVARNVKLYLDHKNLI
ncbi:hypothetical protein PPL_01625 [Heterostelium album PN500]|uniref:Ankyrin repeat protein n=1 Tax=Heterostelium pallidum (strain ATCC 26659 / Pp 5 / PN500) TaxID=670386 RepID=D3B011_HETP5|nr:hypothetical protein PPL_01625 [Heterostelium album PN500]EFA84635.1 hypothetical protein PPL_01625 [Heterostelium album PN500]|eukprot:XP_020436748.1 hypothetical protein PPL_01625 [Heterostelium album PN500]